MNENENKEVVLTAKQRAEVELLELVTKKGKLNDFVSTINYNKLNFAQQYLLTKQLELMAEYIVILEARLSIWEE